MPNEDGPPPLPQPSSLFAVTVNGPNASAEIVWGLEGVREAVLRVVWRQGRGVIPRDIEGHLERLEDAAAWSDHGVGDGQPYWHWWLGLQDGSVSVQRITAPLPAEPARVAEGIGCRARLARATEELVACGAELRRIVPRPPADGCQGATRFR